jgi:hypothetical protein
MNIPAISDLKYLEAILLEIRTEETGGFSYVGKTTVGNYNKVSEPVWQIFRIDETSGGGVQYASGEMENNKIWSSKESYF